MSTKCSYFYDRKTDVHVYHELMDDHDYIECSGEPLIYITPGIAGKLKEIYEDTKRCKEQKEKQEKRIKKMFPEFHKAMRAKKEKR